MNPKILLGLTTTRNSDWRRKVKEIDELKIKEIALFPTCLKIRERRELYKLLETTKLKRIPFVHIRHDFEKWEFIYLEKRFGAKVFNTHFHKMSDKFIAENKKSLKRIYLENGRPFPDDLIYLLDTFAGLCLDISHWEDYSRIQKLASYKKLPKLLKKYKVGCCHISAVRKEPFFEEDEGEKKKFYNSHWLRDLSELNYVKKYIKYLPPVCAIELENSFKEQLDAKKYLEKILFS